MAAAVGGTGSGSVLAIDKSQKNEFESFVNFIRLYHEQQIFNILQQDDDTAHYSLCIDLNDLIKHDVALAYSLLESPSRYLPLMDLATQELQRQTIATHLMRECISEKPNVHVRITSLPVTDDCYRTAIPGSNDIGRLIALTGTVIRTGQIKMMERRRKFRCSKCGSEFYMHAKIEQFNVIPKPVRCIEGNGQCNSTSFSAVPSDAAESLVNCVDYQELKIQEQVNRLSLGTIPRSIMVILEYDLVDVAKSGDEVTIVGRLIRRWRALQINERPDITLALHANYVQVHNSQTSQQSSTNNMEERFNRFWNEHSAMPITGRNKIVKNICPQVYGLYIAKLAVLLVLISGIEKEDSSGMRSRGEAHLLLVGDPGTAKSQFLKFATKLVPRSVLTTGIGSTSAGLTVTAMRDGGEWQLEAGALVLADRGLCCIDEFNSIREHEKTAIHEAMEQQSISVAKAGIVCKLNTRCTVLAATNPKGKYDPTQSISVNVAIGSPLLSRFDLVLVFLDDQNDEWDMTVSSFILDNEVKGSESGIFGSNAQDASNNGQDNILWSIEDLRAYIAYVKGNFAPVSTPGSEQVLTRYYQLQRRADARNTARTTIRLLESLIRLSQAHARLMFRDKVTVQDAVVAVMLMEASMQGSALLAPTDVLYTTFPDNPEEQHAVQEKAVLVRLGLESLLVDESG